METQEQNITAEELEHRGVTYLGELAISREILGINDPLTHLEQYLRQGETALPQIEEDLITDCAERLPDSRFINSVDFHFTGQDFVADDGGFSMRIMTGNTEDKMNNAVVDLNLYKRAQIESGEVDKLGAWFNIATKNDTYIVESLPLDDSESYALSRIYQKVNDSQMTMRVVTLHNPSVSAFNELHRKLPTPVRESRTPLEILGNSYAHRSNRNFDEFIHTYINYYDEVLSELNPGEEFIFGLSKSERSDFQDGMELVRKQETLRGIYLDTIKAIAGSQGRATPAVISLTEKLSLREDLQTGTSLDTNDARDLLDGSLQYIVATLARASESNLEMLAATDDIDTAYAMAGHYGNEAIEAGIRYQGPCPEALTNSSHKAMTTLERAFRLNHDPLKCQTCPGCKKTVDLDKKKYQEGYLHCPKCKLTVPRKDKKPKKQLKKSSFWPW